MSHPRHNVEPWRRPESSTELALLADHPYDVQRVPLPPRREPGEVVPATLWAGSGPLVVPGERVLGVPDVRDRPGRSDRLDRLHRVPAKPEQDREPGTRTTIDAHVAVGQHQGAGVLQRVERPGDDLLEPTGRDSLAGVVDAGVVVLNGRDLGPPQGVIRLDAHIEDVGDARLDQV